MNLEGKGSHQLNQTPVAVDLEAALQTWASIERNELDNIFLPSAIRRAEIVSRGIVKLENLVRIEDVQVLITFYGAYPGARHVNRAGISGGSKT